MLHGIRRTFGRKCQIIRKFLLRDVCERFRCHTVAGKLIQDCGLRGATVGGAQVSEKHCGFVINKGGATSADIKELIAHIQKTVYEKTGFHLECEVRIIPYKAD